MHIRTQSYNEVQLEFEGSFPGRRVPKKISIFYNVQEYRQTGTSANRNRGNSGKTMTARSAENIRVVRDILQNNPREVSVRRNGPDLPNETFNRIVRFDIRWHPYQMKVKQKLNENDFPRRVA
jgi:hypothetical protein